MTGPDTNTTYVFNHRLDAFPQVVDTGLFGFGQRAVRCEMEDLVADGWLGVQTNLFVAQLSVINLHIRSIGTIFCNLRFSPGESHPDGCLCMTSTGG